MPGYDYDYKNADIIIKQLKVKNGQLVLPSGQAYGMMQIPDREDISFKVQKNWIRWFMKGHYCGQKPQRATSLKIILRVIMRLNPKKNVGRL
ncbi:MAG: hypothetical protein IPI77_16330 [Saprospiraceae bacterium]|nr:hypothetical protein [Saprospiraceae bacterium]